MSETRNETLERLARDLLQADPERPHREILRIQEELPRLPGPWQRPWFASWHGSASRIRPAQFVQVLGVSLKGGKSVDAAIARIEEVLATPKAMGAFLFGIIGPSIEQPAEIAPGLSLVPGSAFPRQHSLVDSDDGRPHWVTCCIRLEAEQERPFFESVDGQGRGGSALPSEARRTLDEMHSLLMLFSFPCPITSQGMSFVFDDPEIRMLSGSGAARYLVPGQLPRGWSQSGVPCDVSALPAAWSGLSSMGKGDRARVRTACDRINRALLQMPARPADACIEACIALEALFGGKQTDSLTYKLATRCARFAEADFQRRVERSRFVTKVYGWRSKGVHGASASARLSLDDVRSLCTMLVASARKMVVAGRIPSDEELDFGTAG